MVTRKQLACPKDSETERQCDEYIARMKAKIRRQKAKPAGVTPLPIGGIREYAVDDLVQPTGRRGTEAEDHL